MLWQRGKVAFIFCKFSLFSQKLLGDIKQDTAMVHRYQKQSERAVAAFDNYIMKCIEFSWIAHFENPPIHLITDPKRECPPITDQFIDRKLVPSGKLVEWPALVQGQSLKNPACHVKVPWLLYEKQLPRPDVLPPPKKEFTPPPPKEIARMEIVAATNEEGVDLSSDNVYVQGNVAISMPRANLEEDIYGSRDCEEEFAEPDVMLEPNRSFAVSDKPTKTVHKQPDISVISKTTKKPNNSKARIHANKQSSNTNFPQAKDSTDF